MAQQLLVGWKAIAEYLHRSKRDAQRVEKPLHMPVRRQQGTGKREKVFAYKWELDAWQRQTSHVDEEALSKLRSSPIPVDPGLPIQIYERILRETPQIRLYRTDYDLRVNLTPHNGGVRLQMDCRFELFNATYDPEPYRQELTIDDGEEGWVEELSASFDGPGDPYLIRKPRPTSRPIGFAVYQGEEFVVQPKHSGFRYFLRAKWVMHGPTSDIWQTSFMLPTVGIAVEVKAPPEFETAPTKFHLPNEVVMRAAHLDVAWRRRKTK